MNFDNLPTENVVLNIVKDKLRHDENVLSVSNLTEFVYKVLAFFSLFIHW